MTNIGNQAPLLSVVAPVYNEEEIIEEVVRYWTEVLKGMGVTWEIVLANDGSTDKTCQILSRLAEEFEGLRVVSYKPNRGYGHALATAIRESRGNYVATLDSDGQFDLASVEPLLRSARDEHYDFITGFRVRKKDNIARVVADRALNLIVRVLFRVPFRDTNCAIKLIRGDLARSLRIEASGYPTPTEITVKLAALGASSSEAPVSHGERMKGESKLKFFRTSISMFRFLLYLRHKTKLYKAGVLQSL